MIPSVSPKLQKPYLATLAEQRKIRDYEVNEQTNHAIKTLNALIKILGITETDGDGKAEQHFLVRQFITSDYGRFTFGEIIEAFKMAIKGEFFGMPEWGNSQMYQRLDCVIFARVMACFEVRKRERLRTYNSQSKPKLSLPEISQSEKDRIIKQGIINCFESYETEGKVEAGYAYVFDVLDEKGLIPKNKKQREDALRIATAMDKTDDRILRTMEGKVGYAKRIVLEKYFEILVNEDKHIKDLI